MNPQAVNRLKANLQRRIVRGLKRAGEESVDRVKDSISTPAPPHSLPGEAPHRLEGDLYASIYSDVVVKNGEARLIVGSSDPKASYLEFGTSIMAPRPFLTPEAQNIRRDVTKIIKEEYRKTR